MEAYTLYQRANNYFNIAPQYQEFQLAFDLLEEATDLDPGFAQAYARHALARARAFEVRPGLGGLEDARRIAELALALDPDNGEAHLAMGQYWYSGFRDYPRALEEIELARAGGMASSVDVHHNLGAIQRRMGDYEGSIQSFEEAVRLDPLSAHMLSDLGTTYSRAGRADEARNVFRRALTLAPDTGPWSFAIDHALISSGNTVEARQLIAEMREKRGFPSEYFEFKIEFLDRNYATALGDGDRFRSGDPWETMWALQQTGRASEAEEIATTMVRDITERMAEQAADEERARFPDRANALEALAAAQLGLGRLDDAAETAEEAMRALPPEIDALDGPDTMFWSAMILARAGRTDRAIEVLNEYYDGPGRYSKAYLVAHPGFDPIREHPSYLSLVARR